MLTFKNAKVTQWNKLGDHPLVSVYATQEDLDDLMDEEQASDPNYVWRCEKCDGDMLLHGRIVSEDIITQEPGEDVYIICPNDYIIEPFDGHVLTMHKQQFKDNCEIT